MIYGATIWHASGETKRKSLGPIAKLIILQNKRFWSIIRAYKAINIKVLEAETGMISLDIYLNQLVLRS